MTVPYKINDAVLLSREREGIIRYIGNVHFSTGIWCGIELIGGSVGTNDGKIQGRRYFTCSRNRGLFCKIGKVRRKFREKDHSATSRQKRKASLEQRLFHQSLAQYSIQSELEFKNENKNKNKRHNNIPNNNRYFQKGKPPSNNNSIPNSIEITNTKRNSRTKRSQTTPANTNTKVNWLNERLNHISRKQKTERANSPKPYKPGPRDIGKIHSDSNWKPIDYEIEMNNANNISWKSERIRSKSANIKSNKREKIYKKGPRDIGKIRNGKGWKPIKLSAEEKRKLNDGNFLDDRIEKRRRSKTHTQTKIYKKGPRDIGRMKGWKPNENSKKKTKKKAKKFVIAVEGKEVDPKQLTKSKAKNKQQMKGKSGLKYNKNNKNNKNKNKKKKKKNGVKNIQKNKKLFDSFRRNKSVSDRNRNERASVMVSLNMQNKNIKKNKNIKNNKNIKKRQSAQYIKQMNYNSQRANAFKHINYNEFEAYNPTQSENEIIERRKHFSAANESEADFDLDEEGLNEEIEREKRPSEHVYELFGTEIDGMDSINSNDFISDFSESKSESNDSPSGHDEIYEGGGGGGDGHDNLFDLFEQNESERSNYKKPLPKPPNKPLPIKGRIKGIEKYVGKWFVKFNGLKPNISESKNIIKLNRQKRRTSSVAKKYNNNNNNKLPLNVFTYSIYKDGSVQIQPKCSFGWNGCANIYFDSVNQRFQIYCSSDNQNEYEYVKLNRNGTLNIEHFNHINNYKTPFIGNGVKA